MITLLYSTYYIDLRSKTGSADYYIKRSDVSSFRNKSFYTLHKRSMFNIFKGVKSITKIVTVPEPLSNKRFATESAVKLKGKAAKDYSNDNNMGHAHKTKQYCTLQDCDTKKCAKLCASEDKTRILGHNTHKPPIGRFARFINDLDANGNPKAQYYVRTNKQIEMTATERQNYGSQIKPDPKQDSYMQTHSNKYND